ncbi:MULTISPECIES: GPW/gp25 family protein [unclassified Pseudomonas]|uniref:GPW/gp25 family protein n=1 Tax=unclassified Pseudomonas TaxID=196821 RepID=UPI00215FD2B1|nr:MULTISPECIES: GPW/gp25 family protein [unclassified Pseudomonas]UVM52221.1 GPW/gp25 family protein [Pseudomonas sp. B21-015]WPN60431.1 GPW/gp25 family protein [Pseudomonas sp. P9_31]
MTTPTPYTSITAAHWQPALGTSGEVVEGLRDIDQAIRIVLTTPKGSDAHRPEFGSDIHLYIDWPVNRVTPHLVREAVDAIRRWETRVSVVQVLVLIEDSRIILRVQWRVADGVTQLTEVPYARAA